MVAGIIDFTFDFARLTYVWFPAACKYVCFVFFLTKKMNIRKWGRRHTMHVSSVPKVSLIFADILYGKKIILVREALECAVELWLATEVFLVQP